jgi:2-polyprenyl-3-methyl-5-hydroxy-6-metoxy-1,4-benzoquinol methylase
VNGMAYAWNVMKATIRYRLHKAGLLYARQYDLKGGHKYSFKKNRFSSHQQILKILGDASRGQHWDVLDIGCGAGFLASHVVAMGHNVVGVDIYDSPEARRFCTRFIVADIEQGFGLDPAKQFDCIILADIIEHVRNPETILLRARRFLKPNGRIIASMGNVAHLFIRLELLLGNFVYTERGILDRTHCRLFTRKSFLKLLRDCGFNITQKRAAPLPFDAVITGRPFLSDALCCLNMSVASVWPSLFAYQVIAEGLVDSKATELLRLEEIHDAEYIEYKAREDEMA